MSPNSSATNRAGRPRVNPEGAPSALTGREQILAAAAELFSESGFSGTSTRAIAEKVGIRQQSLYYHFAGKDEILAELLSGSVRPSIEFVEGIEARVPDEVSPAGALFALASIDAGTLRATPHNIGTLYLLPELQDDRYEQFRAQRVQLRGIYGRLGTAAAHPEVVSSLGEARLGAVLLQLAETVIQLRRDDEDTSGRDDDTIAASCLRVLGLTHPEVEAARAEAAALLAGLAAG